MPKSENKKVLMLVYSYHPQDPRPRREAEALIDEGYQVDMLCLRAPGQSRSEIVLGGYVYRVNLQRSRSSKLKYIKLYLSFCIRAFFVLNRLYLKNRYNVIHIHNMPDFLVFLAIIPKLFGSKIILDLHDPSPEILMTIFNYDENRRFVNFIKWIEKVSIKFVHLVITTNQSFVNKFILRGCPPEKIKIIMNSPQTSIFDKYIVEDQNSITDEKFILMYHGLIVERHGLDILAKALAILRHKIQNLELIVCGYGEYEQEFLKLIKQLNLEDIVNFYGEVPIEIIAETIPKINIGIIPNKLTPFTQINFPTRIFEYLCMKKHTVVPRTMGIKDYFDEDEIFYFNSEDEQDLCNVIMNIYLNPEKAKETTNKSYVIYLKHTWERQKKYLIQIYNSLIKEGAGIDKY